MKKIIISIFFMVIFLLNNMVFAGSLKIDRVWTSGDYAYALATYTNDTSSTLKSAVTIECAALDSNGDKININTRSFFAHEYGAIIPGFEGTLKVPVKLYGKPLGSMSCSYRER